jgi:protein-disulfide isomerase
MGTDNDVPLGFIDGTPIHFSDLDPDIVQEMRDRENEAKQREFQLLWIAVEEAISERLLAKEAKTQGLSPQEFERQEIIGKVQLPDNEEIRKIYDANRHIINVEFDVAKKHIRKQLHDELLAKRREELVASLLAKSDVRYSLAVPDLPRVSISEENAHSIGPKDAPVTLVEFADYECPYCSRARDLVSELRKIYPDKLRVVFLDFPLEQHPRARPAAVAAHCAGQQGAFWTYHDLLFDNQTKLEDDDLLGYAKTTKLNLEKFNSCSESGAPAEVIQSNMDAGRTYGVRGTPAIFINGIKLIGLLPLPMMQALIDAEMRMGS